MIVWPELAKTKKNMQNISQEIERLLKNHNALYKKEIANHKEQLLADTQEAIEIIEDEIKQLRKSLEDHRNRLEARAVFLRRHNKRI